jgi:hypothetical protein
MGNLIEVLPTLHRWLAGERIGPLLGYGPRGTGISCFLPP